MSKNLKKLLALLLTLVMLLSLVPTLAFAAGSSKESKSNAQKVHVYTEAENAKLDNDVFASIQSVKDTVATKAGGVSKLTEADYVSMIPNVVKAIQSSKTYVKGSLQRNGNFLVWQTTVGIPCCYDPRMEAELHNTQNDPTPEEIARIEADAASLLKEYNNLRGGSPSSTKIGLIQPYWESSSSYSDSSFTSYSPYYKTTWQNLYGATGGTGMRYSMTNATVDNIANTISQCGLVIFDSHGTTDYSGSNSDYTSRANSSYLCLTTNSGVTSTDTASHTGTYGTYYDCMKGSGYAYVNGQCIANHMTSNAPHSMVYMGICLGMATDRMEAPLRAKGVEVVYGYSQSVSFKGELKSIQSIMGYIQDGMQAGAAIEQSQVDLGCQWDAAYPSYTESQAKSNKIAFPVVSSSEDTYPGHGNVDRVLTAKSTWTLLGSTPSYTVTATTNNSSYGTVSVNGYTITATPKTGYYVSGYTVTSGTATVTQNGNTFTVTPSSNCTVRINFAAKTQYTVTLKANGSTYTTLSAYSGDSVTLPTTATAVSGYTFAGWASSTVSETTTKPTYYAAGATYTPTANTTLYALYTRTDGTGGATIYQLASGVENGGQYIIVASDSISGTTGYAVGNTYVTSSHYLTPVSVTISNNTATASSSNLAKVLWTASGNSSSGYTFYNISAGKYMGLDSSEYLAPTSSGTAWVYTSNGYLDNQVDSEGYYYLSYSSSSTVRYTTSKSGAAINFYKATASGTTYYTTSPSTTTHEHSYGAWTSNNNGTHSRTCSCGDKETANCTYNDVVTAPTTTAQGYTTHTCTVCGYSYVDSYTDPIGVTTYTVSFSVPSGVSAVSSQTVNAGSSITLPTAGAPSGYTFLGWVTSAVNNSTSAPTYLTGTYTPTASITLKALYTYTATSGGGTAYELLDTAPTDWSGNYIITYGTSTSSLYVLKGLSGNKRYESTSAGGCTLYSNTGMSYADGYMTGVTNAYVFTIAKTGSYYTIRNASTGTYLGSYSSYLYSRSSYSSSYCRWTLSMSNGNVTAKNTASSRYPYLSFSSSKYFMMGSSVPSGLYFWRETTTGGTTTTYYTTVIG